MIILTAVFVLIVQFFFVLLNIFGLPGNIAAALPPILLYFTKLITGWELVIILTVVLLGEIIEFVWGFIGSKKTGISNKSVMASIAGALITGILMAPILFGLGALIGSVIGAFAGTFIYEKFSSADNQTAIMRSSSLMKSRLTAVVIKFALGIAVIIMTGFYIFNS